MKAFINKNGTEINNTKKNYLREKLVTLDEFKLSKKYIGGHDTKNSNYNSLDLMVQNIRNAVDNNNFDNITQSDFYSLHYEDTVIMPGYSFSWVSKRRKDLISDILSED